MELGPESIAYGEKCGVIAVYSPNGLAPIRAYKGLLALQDRGRESAGIAFDNEDEITVIAEPGLVKDVFSDGKRLEGFSDSVMAIGHTRYGTAGREKGSQPVYRFKAVHGEKRGGRHVTVGHNGNLTNCDKLSEMFDVPPLQDFASDSFLLTQIFANELDPSERLHETMSKVLPHVEGAFTLVSMDDFEIVGVRDPNGFRPLLLGKIDDGSWVMASEVGALDMVNAKFVREIEAGEMVVINEEGVNSHYPFKKTQDNLCSFEFDYFSRPDQVMYGENVHEVRKRKGRLLALQAPVAADLVIPVPNSGRSAAKGYADASGIELDEGFVKTDSIGRTFIVPGIGNRAQGVRDKLNPIRSVVGGKRLVVVEDSIVHGTTTREVTSMLREAGAIEVHYRIASPPYRWPCFMGMNTSVRGDLIASHMTIDEITEYIGADSLVYLTVENMYKSLGSAATKVCTACMTGEYPIEVPVDLISLRTAADRVYETM